LLGHPFYLQIDGLFSSTSRRMVDVAKLTLVGRLAKIPESRQTKNGRDYVVYTVATTNAAGPANAQGVREDPKTSWHNVLSFSPNVNNYLSGLSKGSLVYVEANYELHEGEPNAEPGSPQSQRQVFLRHDNIKVLKRGNSEPTTEGGF